MQPTAFQSPDGDTWFEDRREAPRIIRIDRGQLYRVDPVIEHSNGWYRVTGYRVWDLLQSRASDVAVVHEAPAIFVSAAGRFGFRTAGMYQFDTAIVEEALATNWRGPGSPPPYFGALGVEFEAAWAPYAARAERARRLRPVQPARPSTPWNPTPSH